MTGGTGGWPPITPRDVDAFTRRLRDGRLGPLDSPLRGLTPAPPLVDEAARFGGGAGGYQVTVDIEAPDGATYSSSVYLPGASIEKGALTAAVASTGAAALTQLGVNARPATRCSCPACTAKAGGPSGG